MLRHGITSRFEYFEELGADSIDGTGLSRYSHMRERIYSKAIQPNLLEGCDEKLPERIASESSVEAAN
jgi:hypothetical protein